MTAIRWEQLTINMSDGEGASVPAPFSGVHDRMNYACRLTLSLLRGSRNNSRHRTAGGNMAQHMTELASSAGFLRNVFSGEAPTTPDDFKPRLLTT
ncbi:hypothetical protein [Novosphingobium panipatense]